ncbi:MAG: hypothetical protein Q4Q28_11185, partial [Bacteroidales bacterium]|nr:hypothetical protein [Bacteroidales bacterium]
NQTFAFLRHQGIFVTLNVPPGLLFSPKNTNFVAIRAIFIDSHCRKKSKIFTNSVLWVMAL